ncbi:TMEM175 family protein [Mucilaginibacter gilvus]|uniref:DUF1211 domain-containing protein n=1 Tax=Mucilaginibacter gilvus TaxID=2305909 RepID=A0A3S3Z604_9SPHI|nr:TMEM175 family protein [Mucilaginibacter gilvus]RWY53986.1 DUF1211 domain-containing protein [Mucilaginibacter gilvus]
MNITEEEEIKKEFQLERVVLFSDAVFAIIITIMVLEMKLPESIRHANEGQVKGAIIDLLPRFLAYILSFFLIDVFWVRHLRMFSILKDYDKGLIILNLAFLFFVSLFPFAASLIALNRKMMMYSWGFNIYFGIILMITVAQTVLIHYLIIKKNTLCIKNAKVENILEWRVQRLNYVAVPVVFAGMWVISYFSVYPQTVVYVFAIFGIVMGRLKRRYYPKNDSQPFLSRLFTSRKKLVPKPIEIVE